MANIRFIISMLIFGSVGLFAKDLALPSGIIATARGLVGAVFLLLCSIIRKKYISFASVKDNLRILVISGFSLGFNWVFLFEAYKHTTIATATLCYYLAPVFVTLASPFLFKEYISKGKLLCLVLSLIGMVMVSNILNISDKSDLIGIILGICAAVFYATVIISNKYFKDISSYDTTVFQLLIATAVLLIYSIFSYDFSDLQFNISSIKTLIIIGLIHTGIAYYLYFSAITEMNSQSIAILSYLDPIAAIIFSAVFLHEPMHFREIIGAVLILGSTAVSSVCESKKHKTALYR